MHKSLYFVLGWVAIVLAIIGAILPLMPTTIFLIIAAWAFSKSSERYHNWLCQHPRFGPLICGWEQHHAIPKRAKKVALIMLAISYSITAGTFGLFSMTALITGVILAAVALYLLHLPLLESKLEPVKIANKD